MTVYDRVTVNKYLSAGCDSVVYRAVLDGSKSKSPSSAIDVAVKMCLTKYLNPNTDKILKIDHENLEKIIYYVSMDEHTYIYSKLLNKTLVKYNAKIDPPLKYLARDMLNALFYFHSLKLAHCDIKSNNIMLDFEGNFVLIDFNNCQSEDKFGKFPMATTLGERHLDLIVDSTDWDYKIDMWAVGTVVYLLFTGNHLLYHVLSACRISESAADNEKLNWYEKSQLQAEYSKVFARLYNGTDYKTNDMDQIYQIVHFMMNTKRLTREVLNQFKILFLE